MKKLVARRNLFHFFKQPLLSTVLFNLCNVAARRQTRCFPDNLRRSPFKGKVDPIGEF